MAFLLSNAPPVSSWDIGTAFIQQKDLSLGMGYYVQHRVGEAQPPVPDSSRGVDASLYYKDCSTPVDNTVKPEPVLFSSQMFSPLNNTFTYEFDIVPSLINNGNMTSFEDDGFGGKSIGHIKFCSIVFTKLDELEVNYRKTIFDLRFDFTDNTFSTENEIAHPQQTFTLSPNVTVNNVANVTAPTSLLTMGSVVETSVANILNPIIQNLDWTMQLNVQSNTINGAFADDIAGGRRLQSLVDLDVGLHVYLTFQCITVEHCDAQEDVSAELMAQIQATLTSSLLSGDIHNEIQSIANLYGVTYFSQASLHPTDGCSFPVNENGELIFHMGDLEAPIPQFFAIQVLDEFTVTACQCDPNSFQCLPPPLTVNQGGPIAICLERNSDDVFIVQLEMKMEGDNGYIFYPVEYGQNGYYEPHPIFTQVSNFDAARILMIKTFLLAGFSTENGGSTSITISGNAMLESKPGTNKHRKLPYAEILDEDFRFTVAIMPTVEEEEDPEPMTFVDVLLKLLLLLSKFIADFFF